VRWYLLDDTARNMKKGERVCVRSTEVLSRENREKKMRKCGGGCFAL